MREFFAIACAIVAALALNYAIYLEKKAVGALPEVQFKHLWSTTKAFITNRPWMSAQIVNIIGFTLYSLALALAPVSIVEPIIASGVALLAYLAIKHLGEKPRRIDYAAIGMSVLGVILIAVSLAQGLPTDKLSHGWEIPIFSAVVIGLAVLIPLLMRGSTGRLSVGLGISVGLFFGIAAVYQRLVMLYLVHISTHVELFVIFLLACIITYVIAFVLLQAALQKGMAIIVAPIYNGLMELVPIMIGTLALGEVFPASNLLKAVRLLAFALIMTGTVILSMRAEAEDISVVHPASEPAAQGMST